MIGKYNKINKIKETKIASKFLLLGISLFAILFLILLVSALSPQEQISQLESELTSSGYDWLVNYSIGLPSIEVYTENGNNLIATLENISSEGWHKTYLTNLGEGVSYDVFDLKINSTSGIEFDYIVDPTLIENYSATSSSFYNATETTNLGVRLSAPVLFMDFNMPNETGNYVKDNSIYNQVGTASGATYNATGGYDSSGAYEFDGVNDNINVPYNTLLNPNQFTMIARAKSNINGSGLLNFIIDNGFLSSSGTGIFLSSSGNISFYGCGANTDSRKSLDKNWHQYALTYNGVKLSFYIDGVNVTEKTCTHVLNTFYAIKIGMEAKTAERYWNGTIDQVQLWNRALSSNEILNLYNGTINNSNYIGAYQNQGDFKSLVFYNTTSTYWNTTLGIADTYSTGTGIVNNKNEINTSDPNLVSYWKFDKSYSDALGRQNLVCGTACPNNATGLSSDAQFFSGASQSLNYAGYQNITGNMTISAWVYPTTATALTSAGIISRWGSSPQRGYTYGFTTGNKVIFYISQTGSNLQSVTSNSTFSLNTWYHIVVVYTAGVSREIYVNGVLDAINSTGTYNYIYGNNTASLIIGAVTASATEAMDEVLIYNKSLTASEINSLYKSGLSQHANTNVTLQYRTASTYNITDPTLVSFWSFNNDNASLVIDELGRNNGTYTSGALSNSSSGAVGNGAYFDGVNDYVNMSNVLNMGLSNWTASAWFKTSSTAFSRVISKNDAGTDGWYIGLNASGSISWGINTTNGVIGTSAYNNGLWHHVTCTWLRSSVITCYVDGISLGTADISSKSAVNLVNIYPLMIGARNDGASANFNGSIDEVRIYNRTLSASEVLDLYNLGATHITDWSAWDSGQIASEGVGIVSSTQGKFMQFKANLFTNDTTVSPYVLSYGLATSNVAGGADTTPPNATILNPLNNSYTNNSNINFTISVSDNTGLANATLNIYNSTGLYNQTIIFLNGVTQTTIGVVVTLVDGVYTWFWQVVDLANNMFTTQTSEGNYTVTVDTTKPGINILYPQNISYTTLITTMNISINEINKNNCFFYNGTGNTSFNCNSNITSGLLSTQGSNTWIVYVNDSAGNLNSSSVTFTVDTTYPSFSTYYDNNASLTNSGTGLFNVTLANTNGTVWLEINNINISATNITASVYNVSYNFTSNGTYSYTWYAYGNGASNLLNNSGLMYYSVNATTISADITSPLNNAIFNYTAGTFNVTINYTAVGIGTNCNATINSAGLAVIGGNLSNLGNLSNGNSTTFILNTSDASNIYGKTYALSILTTCSGISLTNAINITINHIWTLENNFIGQTNGGGTSYDIGDYVRYTLNLTRDSVAFNLTEGANIIFNITKSNFVVVLSQNISNFVRVGEGFYYGKVLMTQAIQDQLLSNHLIRSDAYIFSPDGLQLVSEAHGDQNVLANKTLAINNASYSYTGDLGSENTITNFAVFNPQATINWSGAELNLAAKNPLNLSNAVILDNGFAYVNSSSFSELNSSNYTYEPFSVKIIMNNIDCNAGRLYYGTDSNKNEVIAGNNLCDADTCINQICADGVLTFNVTHFSGYAYGTNSNLTIWDQNDSGMAFGDLSAVANSQIKFFANYTNLTNNPILDANCSIWFNDSGFWDSMSYNSSSLIYDYNRTFVSTGDYLWNVSCNATDYDLLNINDSLSIGEALNSAPTVSSVSLTTTDPTLNDTNTNLTSSVSANDADGDNITLAYNWYKDNVLNATTLITEGLVAYWPLDNDTLDYFGSNDGINDGATINSTNGKINGGAGFDGSDDKINLSISVDGYTAVTVSSWIYNGTKQPRLFLASRGANIFGWYDNGGGNFVFFTSTGGNFDSDGGVTSGWHHWVYTWESGSTQKIYRDGVLNQESGGPISGTIAQDDTIYMGYDNAVGYSNHGLDEVAIYNRSLSASEIQQLYEGSKDGGHTLSSLSSGNYTLGVKAGDYLAWGEESNSSSIDIIQGPDTTSPTFNSGSPYNMESYTNESVIQQINATDETLLDCLSINDTTNFQINCSGYFENITNLSAGLYYINVTINDSSNNINSAEFYVNVSQAFSLCISGDGSSGSPCVINSCQELDQEGFYYQVQDSMNAPSSQNCFTITANNINLDGNNKIISGDGSSSGIYASSVSGLTIKNFAGITNFYYNINFMSVTGSTITNNVITTPSISGSGIYLTGTSTGNFIDASIAANTITGANTGIYLGSTGNTISGNNIGSAESSNVVGITDDYGSNTITSNSFTNNAYAINVFGSGDTFSSNTFTSNTYDYGTGVCLNFESSANSAQLINSISGVTDCFTLDSNFVLDGTSQTLSGTGSGSGVIASSASGVTVRNFAGINSFAKGVDLISATGATISSNSFSSDVYGIYLDSGSTGGTYSSNSFSTNTYDYGTGVCLNFESNANSAQLISGVSASGDCFTIDSTFVLDGTSQTLSGTGSGSGVIASSASGVTVRNFAGINSFAAGVNLTSSSGATISSNSFSSDGYGIYLDSGSTGGTYSSNSFSTNTYDYGTGVCLGTLDAATNSLQLIGSVSASTNPCFAISSNSVPFTFEGNMQTISSGTTAISVSSSSNTVAIQNASISSVSTGVYLSSATGVTVSGLTFSSNSYDLDSSSSSATIIDTPINSYSLSSSTPAFVKTGVGIINFTSAISNSGSYLFGSDESTYDISLTSNSAFVDSTNSGLNASAIVTLYNTPTGLSNSVILRDGINCPAGICTANDDINDGDASFNVTGWSNYSIGENSLGCVGATKTFACGETITESCALNANLTEQTGTCFTVNTNSVIIDGAGNYIDGDDSGTDYGIYINGASGVTVTGFSNISGFYNGIYDDTGGNKIIYNNITSSVDGIYITGGSSGSNISGNTIYSASGYGVNFISTSTSDIISGNSITVSPSGSYGIDFASTTTSDIISDNNIISSSEGIYISSSSYNNITGNNITSLNGNGIYVASTSASDVFYDNNITSAGYGIYVGAASSNNNFTGNIISSTSSYGIDFASSSTSDIISDNNITSSNDGVYVGSTSSNNNFSGNIITSNTAKGINLFSGSTSDTISGNNITSSSDGIYVSGSLYNNYTGNIIASSSGYGINFASTSSSDIISGNNITSSSDGIYVSSASSYNNFTGNSITSNTAKGINLASTSDSDIISDNNITSSSDGISISASSNNNITGNNIYSTSSYGIDFASSSTSDIISGNSITSSSTNLYIGSVAVNLILLDQVIMSYSLPGSSTIIFENTTYGKIDFYKDGAGTGISGSGSNLFGGDEATSDIAISANSAFVNSAKTGLNVSAIVTLYNTPIGFSNPTILRDGANCPAEICAANDNINDGDASFNVTGWSNYSIGETLDTIPPVFTNLANQSILNNMSLSYDIDATDDSLPLAFWINDTTNFAINSASGLLENITELLVGTYWINVSVNDTIGNIASAEFYVNVSELPWSCSLYSMTGDGSSGSPCQITNWTQLNATRNNLTASYILMNNLTATDSDYIGLGDNWMPIGNSTASFSGNFNGNNNTISNLTINLPSTNYVGLFGFVTGNISNLGLINVNVTGNNDVGSLVGDQNGKTIFNSYSTGTVTGTGLEGPIGGLVGMGTNNSLISHCYSNAFVNGKYYVGGLVGEIYNSEISNSYTINSGIINGNTNVGTLVGVVSSGNITNCTSIVESFATITGTSNVGFIGSNAGGITVTNSYLTIRNTTYGNITFLNLITGGTGNMLDSISIDNNSVYVNSSKTYLNVSANITLIDLSTSYTNPVIYRDGTNICNSTTTPSCYNFTSLNAGTVRFNVSSWSNYSIGEAPDTTYPTFSNYYDNNATLINSGTGLFNVTVTDTNGTVWLEINNTNISASNLSANVYNVSYDFTNNGTYSYTWYSYGSGSSHNLNNSGLMYYSVNYSDTTPPNATILAPENATITNQTSMNFTINVSDNTGLANATLFIYTLGGTLYNQTTVILNGVTQATVGIVVTLADGVYTWFWQVVDLANNMFTTQTSEGNRTLTIDATSPLISIVNPTNTSYNNRTLLVNITANDDRVDKIWFNWNGTNQTYSTPVLVTFAEGANTLHAYANDSLGNLNSTQVSFSIDTSVPQVSYSFGTENNNEMLALPASLYVGVASNSLISSVNYTVYNGSGIFNSTVVSVAGSSNTSSLTFVIPENSSGNYTYYAKIVATNGLSNTTENKTVTGLKSCLNYPSCLENSNCLIGDSCYLFSAKCTNSVCDFVNFEVNASGKLYTLYDTGTGAGMSLALNISGNNSFGYGSRIIFGGKNGSSIAPGSQGGNAGTVNITVSNLFNTTFAMFEGVGGYSTLAGANGGSGGILQLNFRGLIRNFSDSSYVWYFDEDLMQDVYYPDNSPVVAGGFNSSLVVNGTNGSIIYNKNLVCTSTLKRDVDVNRDGLVGAADVLKEKLGYNAVTGEANYTSDYDINCDGLLNVKEIAKIGFEYDTR